MEKDSLSGEALLNVLEARFSMISDPRRSSAAEIPLKDFLMSGLAIFSLKFPSLLKFEEEARRSPSSLTGIYHIQRVPSDTHMRSVLDEVDPTEFRSCYQNLFERARRVRALDEHRVLNGNFLLSVDGSGYFSSPSVHCASCMEKTHASGSMSYYHQMLTGAFVHPEKSTVIPVCPEPIQRQNPSERENDSERSAFARFINGFRRDHPHLSVIVNTDPGGHLKVSHLWPGQSVPV